MSCFLLLITAVGYSQVNKQQTVLQLNTFTDKEVPKEIDGCTGYFYRNMNDRKLTKYIGINDLGLLAFIKIGNKIERFVQIKFTNVGKTSTWLYHNKDKTIQLIIEIKKSRKTGSESEFITGTITATSNGKKTVIDFVGDKAC